MGDIRLITDNALPFVDERAYRSFLLMAGTLAADLENASCPGSDFLGWLHLPSLTGQPLVDDINATAKSLQDDCDVVVVAGIGGSYLGAKSALEALSNPFNGLRAGKGFPEVVFAGNNISEDYLYELKCYLSGKKFGIVNISKSGTTTETAISFRVLKELCEESLGKEFARRNIVAITDAEKGAARLMADKEGYKSYIIPDDVGGRFSVLTPVGLFPIAVAGFDIAQLLAGARDMEGKCSVSTPADSNIAAIYASLRNALYQSGRKIEILVNFTPKLHYVMEWWKQLFGESEGKDNKGIFPASVDFTTDLHSMGQWIQQGERTIFETVVSVDECNHELRIPSDSENLDGLNYIAGKRIGEVNTMAELGTLMAHVDGNVPNIKVCVPCINEYYLGQLFYFFEKSCALSGLMLGVNPFNQPGVEDYKRNMFALLDKPGYEKETLEIRKRADAMGKT